MDFDRQPGDNSLREFTSEIQGRGSFVKRRFERRAGISESPGIFRQLVCSFDDAGQRGIQAGALPADLIEVVHPAKRNIVSSQKGLKGFFRRLLRMEQGAFDIRGICREEDFDSPKVLCDL